MAEASSSSATDRREPRPHDKDALAVLQANKGGFDFDLCYRNDLLKEAKLVTCKAMKTGTTIAGITFKDGVVLGADTRATEGPIVADKNCIKIHYIASRIYCCGAGTSADTENVTALISSQLELHRLNTGREPRVATALTRLKQHLFRYQGHVSAALVLGGVDGLGSYIHTVYPHGSTDRLPYATMGSGSLAAMAIFESRYKENMSRQEAIALVADAITAGIFNDLGSGSNVDICIITRPNVEFLRNYQRPGERMYRKQRGYKFPRGSTDVISETKSLFKKGIVVTNVSSSSSSSAKPTPMET